jgi:putative transcriptional regulator
MGAKEAMTKTKLSTTALSRASKPKRAALFARVKGALEEAHAHARGADDGRVRVHVPDAVDVRAIRDGLELTQDQFAARFGFTLAAVRDWEQGRRQPERAARVLLLIIAREPDAVRRALD